MSGQPDQKRPQRTHPASAFISGWLVVGAFLLTQLRGVLRDSGDIGEQAPLLLVLLGGAALLMVGGGLWRWWNTLFFIDDDEFRVESGRFFHTSKRLAYSKIQSVDIRQPLLARLFDMCALVVDTGNSETVELRFLRRKTAESLHDFLLARAASERAGQPVGGVGVPQPPTQALVKLPNSQIVLSKLLSLSLWLGIAVPVALAIAAFVLDIWWVSFGGFLAVGVGAVGFVWSRIVGQLNFQVSRTATGLRVQHGLTDLRSYTVPRRRIQAVSITQPWLWRRLGLYRVDAAILGGGGEEKGDESGSALLAAGTWSQVEAVLGECWPGGGWQALPVRPVSKSGWWLHPLRYRGSKWGYDGHFFVAKYGWLDWEWVIAGLDKVQSVGLVAGPLDRRLAICNLQLHTAGAEISVMARWIDAAWAKSALAELSQLPLTPSAPREAPPIATGGEE
ncbi:MAG: PH domain-containing protein [Propionibacteriaceae bacterium]|nr:PH domain-containing protein [Propionibacteriaceae bacterium]